MNPHWEAIHHVRSVFVALVEVDIAPVDWALRAV